MLLAPPRQDASPSALPDGHAATGTAGRGGEPGSGARPGRMDGASQPEGWAHAPEQAACADLCATLIRQGTVDESVRLLLGWLQSHGRADEVRLGWYEKGHVRLSPLTCGVGSGGVGGIGGGAGEASAADISCWTDAMEEALDQGQPLCWPPGPAQANEWVTLAQHRLAGDARARVLTLILPGAPEPLGALSLRWRGGDMVGGGGNLVTESAVSPHAGLGHPGNAPADEAHDDIAHAWQTLASQIAPILGWQRHADRAWHWHLRQAMARAWRHSRVGMRANPKRAALALALAIAVLALLPLPERAGGAARIEGAQQRVLAATSDGFIKQVYAQPGDRVKAGQVLADLAEQDLKLEREKWTSQAAQQDNAYAAAMTRADRAEAALALSRLEEAQAQLALVDEQLQRTQLKAPFDGVLIQGDLSQSVGAPVKQGETLMTVASTQRWRVIVEIEEADIGRVRIGQEGAIALSALPWDTLPLRVRRITPLAQARDGRNLFEVEAEFTAPVPGDVRPGLTGQARIRIGQRPLLWSWLRPLAERLRLSAWSWWGG